MLPRLALEAALRLRSSFSETPGGLARRPLPAPPAIPIAYTHPNKLRHTINNFNIDLNLKCSTVWMLIFQLVILRSSSSSLFDIVFLRDSYKKIK